MKNKNKEQLASIDHQNLVTVTGGIAPAIAVPVAIGVAATVGSTLWSTGHDKGLAERNCK